jgi:hypothetical protein
MLIANTTITLESVGKDTPNTDIGAAVEVLEDISFFGTMGQKLVERLGAKVRKSKHSGSGMINL